jgi:hypothetical protein
VGPALTVADGGDLARRVDGVLLRVVAALAAARQRRLAVAAPAPGAPAEHVHGRGVRETIQVRATGGRPSF